MLLIRFLWQCEFASERDINVFIFGEQVLVGGGEKCANYCFVLPRAATISASDLCQEDVKDLCFWDALGFVLGDALCTLHCPRETIVGEAGKGCAGRVGEVSRCISSATPVHLRLECNSG